MSSDSTSSLNTGVSTCTSPPTSSNTPRAGEETKNGTERKWNTGQFCAGDRRPRLSKARSSDEHENAIEEDDKEEDWEDEKDSLVFQRVDAKPNLITYPSQLSLLIEMARLRSATSSESQPAMQKSNLGKEMLEKELDETTKKSMLHDREFKKSYTSQTFHGSFDGHYPAW